MKDDAEGLKAIKYRIGDKEVDGHDHIFYQRDDLPVATTSSLGHAHSISAGPMNTVICEEAAGHIHTKLVIEEKGDYVARTLIGDSNA